MSTKEGYCVVRRSDRLWARLSVDLVIEQMLIRSMKTSGSITRGRACAEVNNAMQDLTGVNYNTGEQNNDTSDARQARDMKDTHYTERWMKTRLSNSNKTFQYCKNPKHDEFKARPSIKVMGFSEPQIDPKRSLMLWDPRHKLAIVPNRAKIQYLEEDGQIGIKQAGVYHVYSQVHFDHKQTNSSIHPVVFSHMILRKKAGETKGTIVMQSRETEGESEDPQVVGSSYLASSLQLEDGDRLYVNVDIKDDVLCQPQMNFFGAHML
ncbi:hypothetical protein MAR_022633 [Mya arenaria]|uniref:THD domain-containing protein n=1 Tax=Mya arenaria TaxID=6604 RepID=A0ABY7DPH1_MYAAR|nr:hypothetical protein MAR_022633 [Mya arenaria]